MTNKVLVRFGGVIVPPLYQVISEVVKGATGINLSNEKTSEIRETCEEFSNGKMPDDSFFEKMSLIFGLEVGESIFLNRIVSIVSLPDEVLGMLNLMKQHFSVSIIVDYPLTWFREILAKYRESKVFNEINIMHLSEIYLNNKGSTNIEEQLSLNTTQLIIEPDNRRAMEYIQNGIQVIHFINSSRTLAELRLRKLIPI